MDQYPLIYLGAPHRNGHYADLKADQQIDPAYAKPLEEAWLLDDWLEALSRLDYPKERITLSVLANDCTDDSMVRLCRFRDAHQHEYRKILIQEHNQGVRPYLRNHRMFKFAWLATVRNLWLESLKDEGWVFSVDTDIIIEPDTLSRLLAHGQPIVSALVSNYYGHYTGKSCNILEFLPPKPVPTGGQPADKYSNPRKIDPTVPLPKESTLPNSPCWELLPVHVTGACYLFSRAVVDAGVRYAGHVGGEDYPFCIQALEHGFSLACDRQVRPFHCMNGAMLPELAAWKRAHGWI